MPSDSPFDRVPDLKDMPLRSSDDPAALIGRTTDMRPDQLHTFHRNARRGDVEVIMGSLKAHSQYRPIVVNIGTYTGRANEVLAGNHTLMAIRRLAEQEPTDLRWSNVKVHWGDWDEDTCTKIVLADNRTAEIGGMDFAQLKDLLESIPDMSGTGYSEVDYTALCQSLIPPSLDALAGEYGDKVTADDLLEGVGLKLEPDVKSQWLTHRSRFSTDTQAMQVLLSSVPIG